MLFDVGILFKIGAMGILLMVIEKVLEANGKERDCKFSQFSWGSNNTSNCYRYGCQSFWYCKNYVYFIEVYYGDY